MSETDEKLTPQKMLHECKREKWPTRKDFYLSTAGSFIGLGNVWRFPYLCYENGGAIFFLPYMIFLVLAGIPIFLLEISVGQYTSEGGLTAWNILAPITSGIGYGGIILTTVINIYYIVVLAWAVYYMGASCTSAENLHKIWNSCDNEWNVNGTCKTIKELKEQMTNASTASLTKFNTNNKTFMTPIEEYWENQAIKIGDDMTWQSLSDINWPMFFCVCFSWVVCYFCIWKGLRWTSKVASFTATFPVVMLVILLIRGLTLEGASTGLEFYLIPKADDWSKLYQAKIWIDAGTQVLYSYALCKGALLTLGSYNKFKTDCYKDVYILSCCNSGVSVISGIAIFSVLGFMADEFGVTVENVAKSGPGLAFIAYPQAILQMPMPSLHPVWAFAFFLMIFLLGLDTQFVGLEAVATSICDLYPTIRRPGRREWMIFVMVALSAVVALPMCTPGGIYLFKLYDYYGASGFCLLFLSACQCLAVCYIYGGHKFWRNLTSMIGYEAPKFYVLLCWQFVTPIFCLAITLLKVVKFKSLEYPRPLNRTKQYTAMQESVGWILASFSMLPVLLMAIYYVFFPQWKIASDWAKVKQNWKDACKPRDQQIQHIVYTLGRSPESELGSMSSLASEEDDKLRIELQTLEKVVPESEPV